MVLFSFGVSARCGSSTRRAKDEVRGHIAIFLRFDIHINSLRAQKRAETWTVSINGTEWMLEVMGLWIATVQFELFSKLNWTPSTKKSAQALRFSLYCIFQKSTCSNANRWLPLEHIYSLPHWTSKWAWWVFKGLTVVFVIMNSAFEQVNKCQILLVLS